MIYLYCVLALAACLLAYMRFEAGNLEVVHVRFTKSSKAFKIIQLSDIHINRLKVSPEKVKKAIKREKPDLVIITGDYIDKASHIPDFLRFLDVIKEDNQMVLCLGNHDYKALSEDENALARFVHSIENIGAVVLQNQSVQIKKNSKRYNIIGIGDSRSHCHDIEKALEASASGSTGRCVHDSADNGIRGCTDKGAASGAVNIAFTHNPDVVLEIPRGKVDFLFCGHFHGGQIWAPFNLEFKMLRDEKLCKMGIRRGLHKVNGINLYINRGLGNVCVPLRFLSRPEITVFHMP